MKTADKPAIGDMLRDLLVANPDMLNGDMAEAINQRLDVSITSADVSVVRNEIGLGVHQQIEQRFKQHVLDGLREDRNNRLNALFAPYIDTLNMGNIDEELQDLALIMAVRCVRNTIIEDYHDQGKLTGAEMKEFNVMVVNRLYTFLNYLINPSFGEQRDDFLRSASAAYPRNWDKPVLDPALMMNKKLPGLP